MATMAKRDYYEVLGLAKNASPEEIKKNFRNKARDLHPDNKDSGDEAAFKELAEAYEILSDEQKRASYDRYGHEGVKNQSRGFDNVDFSSMAGFGIDDFIEFFFGGGMRTGGRRGGPEQGAHLKYDLEIEFLEAVFGTEKKINIRRLEDCATCEGSGAAPGSTPVTCVACAGMGQVQQVVNSWFGQTMRVIECPTCHGSGQKIDKPCRDCKGEALVRKSREFQLKIPAGIEAGSRLRLTSAGDKGRRGGTFGDLFVIIHVKEHKQFIRDGETIHLRQPISFSMAALGGEMMVPTVDGPRQLKIAAGVQHGTTQMMREMGVPRFNNPSRRGDQVVHLVVETPTKLTSEEKKLLEQLAELRSERLHLSPEELAEIEARKEASAKEAAAATAAKAGAAAKGKHSKKEKEEEKEDSSIIDKIVDAFRPKNGDEAK
ncbi:MAG: molecular chaperone DnaJ [Cyanobacteria bacterium SZAS-4]|nr:molecular chaperone DnaJ [Cyanobacteria bacterium SZAS-4]